MPDTIYKIPNGYSIQNDFPNHKVATDRLTQEIQQSSIITALAYINTTGDVCAVVFKDVLSVGDLATLNTIVANHSGEPLPNNIPQPVQLYAGAGDPTPTASGVPVMLPNLFPVGVVLDLIGAGDHATNGRGEGPQFQLTGPADGSDISLSFQFNDWVTFAGGGMNYTGGLYGDNVDMVINAPATPVTPSAGGNTGNCNLVDPGLGAAVLLVPAPGNGAFNVNLANAIPIPASANNGFYEWDCPDTGKGTITVGVPNKSAYNLFAIPLPLSRYVTKMPILDSHSVNLTIPAIKPTKILPQWVSKVTLRTPSLSQAKFTWYLVTARMKTTG